jgi:putative endopeptidase
MATQNPLNSTVTHGIQIQHMDLNVNPGTDFNLYCNGTWLKNTEIPADYPRWGMFMKLRDEALQYLVGLFNRLSTTESEPGSNAQKIGDLYFTGMNEAGIEAEGLTALQADLAHIARIRNLHDLVNVVARLHLIDAEAFFGFGAAQDPDDSDKLIAHAVQSGTSQDRDFYLKTDKDTIEKREKYLKHIEGFFTLLGEKGAVARRHAQAVLSLETALANISMSNKELRDPEKARNKMSIPEFQTFCPNINMTQYFEKLGAPAFETINVRQVDFFKGLGKVLSSQPMWALRAYLRFHLVSGMASFLPKRFGDHSFEFNGKVMVGTQVQQERWKRITNLVSGALGEAVGQFYVADNFPPEAKARMLELNEFEKTAMKLMFREMKWMSPQTQDYAIEKLEAFVCNIGYPDKWRDYSALHIDRSSYVGNILNIAKFGARRNLNKIGGNVDLNEWGMTPQTVNAQCSQTKNMTFYPAAIFQPPFFDMHADIAFILGAIGAVIGHENWHNFDDKGSLYNLKGNLSKWWAPQDDENFKGLMKKIKDLFESFVVIEAADGKEAVHMQGELVCGEAISDLMGLRIAYRALQLAIAKYGRTVDEHGFTDEQRFFIAFAQLWASKSTPDYQINQASNDPHPVERFRVNGTLSNMPEFRAAFNLPADCPMVLAEHLRCDLFAEPKAAQ